MSAGVDSNSLASPQGPLSPKLGPVQRTRRLSARRGSITAVDPFGEHADINLNPARQTSSRLTIVRLPPGTDTDYGRNHRRHGSNASIGSASSKGAESAPGRMSFAFSSFAPSGANAGRASPPSPRVRPSTPGSPRLGASLPPSQPKLSPEDLVELARQSVNPRPQVTAGGPSPSVPSPVSFTPLPDDLYLPFIDRPAEVSTLITQPPTNKLFALLAQTFPSSSSTPTSTSPSEYTNSAVPPPSVESDPKQWSFQQLISWLRNVDRDVADDVTWVRKARACILNRSELIWERIRGALGVPPELNVDDDELEAILEEPPSRPGIPISGSAKRAALEEPVFEPDSPTSPAAPLQPSEPVITSATPLSSSVLSEMATGDVILPSSIEEVHVEPVIAATSPAPPPPSASSAATALEEVREEEEEEENDDGDKKEGLLEPESPEVMGLRFSTSPAPSIAPVSATLGQSPVLGSSASPSGSFVRSPVGSADDAYDPNLERGPGRPLFPSNFAQLSLGPNLSTKRRAHSVVHPPPALDIPSGAQTSASVGHTAPINIAGAPGSAGGHRPRIPGMPSRAEFDMGKHEYAVSTTSASAVE
ncbi:hypothetical protein K474DRAFT_1685383 [Panus rudis PR-1116 ss-1]|nr:hypothetical protein K474DRAFT_1685383 [Panus rudis PR-1116 ss-1]